MNRRIKSGKEIKKDIAAIFDNSKTNSELFDNIVAYLANINRKELYSQSFIEIEIQSEILDRILNDKLVIDKNGPVAKMYPFFRGNDAKSLKIAVKSADRASKNKPDNHAILRLLSQIHYGLENIKEYPDIFPINKNYFAVSRKKYPAFKKFEEFILNNNDVAVMLLNHVDIMIRNTIVYMVQDKSIPLKSILIYFDTELNIKENTEALYILLDKKIPRQNIQTVIHANLDSLKGK